MIPCQEDDKHLKSRMFKVTVTSKNLTRGVKSRGILLTMNRLLLKIHLYKNELIREGAQVKRILQKHAGLAIWPGMWLKAHISVTYNIFVMTVIGMFYCIITQSWSYVPCWNKGHQRHQFQLSGCRTAWSTTWMSRRSIGEACSKAQPFCRTAVNTTSAVVKAHWTRIIRHLRAFLRDPCVEKNGIPDSKKGGNQ